MPRDAQHPGGGRHLQGRLHRHRAVPLPLGPPSAKTFATCPTRSSRRPHYDAAYAQSHLDAFPMYVVVFSFNDPYDTNDMLTTGGGEADYDIDFPRAITSSSSASYRARHFREA